MPAEPAERIRPQQQERWMAGGQRQRRGGELQSALRFVALECLVGLVGELVGAACELGRRGRRFVPDAEREYRRQEQSANRMRQDLRVRIDVRGLVPGELFPGDQVAKEELP